MAESFLQRAAWDYEDTAWPSGRQLRPLRIEVKDGAHIVWPDDPLNAPGGLCSDLRIDVDEEFDPPATLKGFPGWHLASVQHRTAVYER